MILNESGLTNLRETNVSRVSNSFASIDVGSCNSSTPVATSPSFRAIGPRQPLSRFTRIKTAPGLPTKAASALADNSNCLVATEAVLGVSVFSPTVAGISTFPSATAGVRPTRDHRTIDAITIAAKPLSESAQTQLLDDLAVVSISFVVILVVLFEIDGVAIEVERPAIAAAN